MCHRHANKGHAVRSLRQRVGAQRLVCFGDNRNDLEMFQVADEGHAVANAHPDLIRSATSVIGANSAHGVAEYLRLLHPPAGG